VVSNVPRPLYPLYPLDTKKGEPQSQCEQDKKKTPDLLEIEPRFLGHPVSSLVTISEFALLFGNYSVRMSEDNRLYRFLEEFTK